MSRKSRLTHLSTRGSFVPMADLNAVSIERAAEVLGLSVSALRARLQRAAKRDTEDGIEVDLGHGVVASMPSFTRKWFLFIPHGTVVRMAKVKKRLGKAWGPRAS